MWTVEYWADGAKHTSPLRFATFAEADAWAIILNASVNISDAAPVVAD
jgi:hypothetical protein